MIISALQSFFLTIPLQAVSVYDAIKQFINAQMVYLTNEELTSREEKTTVLWYGNPYIYYFPCHSDRGTVGYIHTVMSTASLCAMLFWRSFLITGTAGKRSNKHSET